MTLNWDSAILFGGGKRNEEKDVVSQFTPEDDNVDKWFLPGILTDEQKQLGKQFREHLQSKGLLIENYCDELVLLRFLKARQWNIPLATSMYKAMGQWRKEHQVDELYRTFDFPELKDLLLVYPHFYHKTDKNGRPVYIEMLGKTDCAQMLNITTVDKFYKYHIWSWERFERQLLPAVSKWNGTPLLTCVVIIDLKGLSMKNFTITTQKVLSKIFKVDQDFYPEHLAVMYIINTPLIFKTIWNVISPLLEERTRKKIQVYGADYEPALKEIIPVENLLTIFGGKSEVPDHYATVGPW
eukprot:CAMPEP_0202404792 /NCGR_PEP_ID=MMETSP1128-20130828/5934_1 /ASSEMBLY_ACC=CAM_ASM_000463 /TAXON_ID=3047 /ORGANISM="Dunaliella tertiolecta, Strain CCMP1320" /LENGTH=296 /DNA_ID=CAMNT_0049009347 /DNA_START=58 /DNA_END=945 /DNA_ORIENTATION=+